MLVRVAEPAKGPFKPLCRLLWVDRDRRGKIKGQQGSHQVDHGWKGEEISEPSALALHRLDDSVDGFSGTVGETGFQVSDYSLPVPLDALGHRNHFGDAGVADPVIPPLEPADCLLHFPSREQVLKRTQVGKRFGRLQIVAA